MRTILVTLLVMAMAVTGAVAQTLAPSVQNPTGNMLGVRNISATALKVGDAVKFDTTVIELVPDSVVGTAGGANLTVLNVSSFRFALPETVTVSRDSMPGFVLRGKCIGSTGGGTDSVIIVGTVPHDVGVSLTNGFSRRTAFPVNVGGDSLFYFGTYISIDSVYCNTAQTNLDTIILQQMCLYGVSKADSANGVSAIGVVTPTAIPAYRWGRIVTSRIGGRAKVLVNGNTTKVYPWDKLRFGTSGMVKHSEKSLKVVPIDPTKYAGADTVVATQTATISDSTFGYAIEYTGTTGDTTSILLRQY